MDTQSLSDVLRSISRGFVQTPEQRILFIAILAAFVMLIVLVYFLQELKAKARHLRNASEVYDHLTRQLGLSRSERALVDRLAGCCKPPDKKYLVLLNSHTFDACAERLRDKEEIPEMILAALRLKLDFSARGPEDIPASSSELPRGMRLHLTQKGKPAMKAQVSRQDPEALVITLAEGSMLPNRGVPLTVYFQNQSGIFAFLSHARKLSGRTVFLDHSEAIKRSQRRKYYRRPIRLSATIALENSPERQLRTTILDLSGGGARIENPGAAVEPGDRLVLYLRAGAEHMTLAARVVRKSHGDEFLHLQFESLSDAARDRLIGLVFRAKVDLRVSVPPE
jgi:c-di-GMP-binding flagellar brake protein YcgR